MMKNNNFNNENVNSVDTNDKNNKHNGDDFMKNLIKERIAEANEVSTNNKMLKKAERSDIKREYIIAKVMTEYYNHDSEVMPPNTEFPEINRIRQDSLNALKYSMYYDWSYY